MTRRILIIWVLIFSMLAQGIVPVFAAQASENEIAAKLKAYQVAKDVYQLQSGLPQSSGEIDAVDASSGEDFSDQITEKISETQHAKNFWQGFKELLRQNRWLPKRPPHRSRRAVFPHRAPQHNSLPRRERSHEIVFMLQSFQGFHQLFHREISGFAQPLFQSSQSTTETVSCSLACCDCINVSAINVSPPHCRFSELNCLGSTRRSLRPAENSLCKPGMGVNL